MKDRTKALWIGLGRGRHIDDYCEDWKIRTSMGLDCRIKRREGFWLLGLERLDLIFRRSQSLGNVDIMKF
jgi:hypothetical protein